jgi:outer membrane lipoprotein carrier protein
MKNKEGRKIKVRTRTLNIEGRGTRGGYGVEKTGCGRKAGRTRGALAFFGFLGIAGAAFMAGSARGETAPRAAAVVNALESRYHGAKTLKAVFLEEYREGKSVTRVESGMAYFSKPGRMRWEYEEPEKKFFLSDGKTVWFYVPSDHTVTRSAMKESSDWRTPLALLTGKADLGKICSKVDVAEDVSAATAGDVMLRCTPKAAVEAAASRNAASDAQALTPDQTGDIRDILLEVNPKDGWLESVVIKQSGGIEMEYRFAKWEENLDLPEVMFHFEAPKGVAIVDGGL